MKRYLFVLCLISTVFLGGCNNRDLTVDMSKTVTDTNALPVNLPAEVARAKSENKLLLIEFGSSDSCPPCVLLQQKVFSTPEFMAFEKTNLDFVRLDYPFRAVLRSETKATNDLLEKQFGVLGYPTFIALDRDGTELWRTPEKDNANPTLNTALFQPQKFIALLEVLKQKEK